WVETGAPVVSLAYYTSVACSADGATVIAVQQPSSGEVSALYISTNSGVTWMTNALSATRLSVVGCSADGATLLAMSRYSNVFSSNNAGATWRSNNVPGSHWNHVLGSADGTKWVASASANENATVVYTSQDSGA